MKVAVDKSFEKDTNRIREVQNCKTIHQINNLKKLKGGSIYYRIRIGDYRFGLIIESNVVNFVCFLHRKDIS